MNEPQTLLEWGIENGSLLVFAVCRTDDPRARGMGGDYRLADVIPSEDES